VKAGKITILGHFANIGETPQNAKRSASAVIIAVTTGMIAATMKSVIARNSKR
jgi:hypothetical protein